MSPIHSASLVDSSLHSKATLELLDLDITRNLIEHIVHCTVDAIDYALNRPSSSRGRSELRSKQYTSFTGFVSNVIHRSEVKIPTILSTLVYIRRAKPHLSIQAEEWALERVFLGAIIVASKYTNDSTMKNVHWAMCTGVFGKRDVGRIEREFIDVLDWDLSISESDILDHHDAIMALYPRPHHLLSASSTTKRHSALSSHWSDSDSDDSVSSGLCSPSTLASPSNQPSYVKPPHSELQLPQSSHSSSRSRLVDALQSISLPWNSKHNPPTLHPSLQLPVRV